MSDEQARATHGFTDEGLIEDAARERDQTLFRVIMRADDLAFMESRSFREVCWLSPNEVRAMENMDP